MIQQQRFGGTLLGVPVRIHRDFGMQGLFRGLVATTIRDSIYVGGLLGTTPLLQKYLEKEHGWGSTASESVASIVSGVGVGVVTCPMDAVSTSMKGDLARETYGGFV